MHVCVHTRFLGLHICHQIVLYMQYVLVHTVSKKLQLGNFQMVPDYQWRAKKFPKPLANIVMMLNFQTKLLHQAVEYTSIAMSARSGDRPGWRDARSPCSPYFDRSVVYIHSILINLESKKVPNPCRNVVASGKKYSRPSNKSYPLWMAN
jgi:hypothetical protein